MIIIAHGDVDGIASAAIALRRHPSARVIFAEPHSVDSLIQQFTGNEPEEDILVLDLQVQDRGKVRVIDHHSDVALSTTTLMKNWEEATSYLVALGQWGDRGFNSDKMAKLDAAILSDALALKPFDNDFREVIARTLAVDDGIRTIPVVQERALEYEELIRFLAAETAKRVVQSKPGKWALVVWEDIPGGRAGRAAVSLLASFTFVCLVWRTQKNLVVTMRASQEGQTCLKVLSKLQQIDRGKGGGHRYSASYNAVCSDAEHLVTKLTEILEVF